MAKKAAGKGFEQETIDSVPAGFLIYRLKDAPPFMGDDRNKFTPKNICDFIIANPANKKIFWVENKECQQASLSFSRINLSHLEKMVAMHSIGFSESYILIKWFNKREGTFALRGDKALCYIEAQNKLEKGKKSFSYDWIVENSIRLPERKLKVNTRYDFTKVFGDAY